MELNLKREIAALEKLSAPQLRARYAEVFCETTLARNKPWLIKRIAWRLQSLAEGDLSERAQQRAAELARDADVRMTPPKPRKEVAPRTIAIPLCSAATDRVAIPGTLITREYKGKLLAVTVLEKGFVFEGVVYKSLSAVAKHITGQHCSGHYFFRLSKEAS